jgi:hypothetical protein
MFYRSFGLCTKNSVCFQWDETPHTGRNGELFPDGPVIRTDLWTEADLLLSWRWTSESGICDSSTTVERNHWNPVYGICYE